MSKKLTTKEVQCKQERVLNSHSIFKGTKIVYKLMYVHNYKFISLKNVAIYEYELKILKILRISTIY